MNKNILNYIKKLLPYFDKLVILCVYGSGIALAITGFGSLIVCGHLTAFPLIIHTGLGAMFAISILGMLILRAETCSFEDNKTAKNTLIITKIIFWLAGVCTLILLFSILVAMLPIFGTCQQSLLLEIHKYTAIIITILGFMGLLQR